MSRDVRGSSKETWGRGGSRVGGMEESILLEKGRGWEGYEAGYIREGVRGSSV